MIGPCGAYRKRPGMLQWHFMRMLKVVKHPDVTLYELQGYEHGMVEPAIKPMLNWIREKVARDAE